MYVRRRYLILGVFLLCLGAVPLAVDVGLLSAATAGDLARLWPLILIGLGLGVILRFSRIEVLGGIVVAGTFGLLLGTLLAGGVGALGGCLGPGGGVTTATQSGSISSGTAEVQLEMTCGDLFVSRTAGNAWTLQSGGGDAQPYVEASTSHLAVRSDDTGNSILSGRQRERWDLALPQGSSLALSFTLNGASGTFGLGAGPVGSVSGTLNGSDGRIDLSGATSSGSSIGTSSTLNASSAVLILPSASVDGSITLNASSLTICAPSDAALHFMSSSTFSSDNFGAAGLRQVDGGWQTDNYGSAPQQVDLRLSANVSSLTLDRSGGCPQ
jgi:hypothetical protein